MNFFFQFFQPIKERIALSTGWVVIQQIKHVGKSIPSPKNYEQSKRVSIIKCMALQKSGQMSKLNFEQLGPQL